MKRDRLKESLSLSAVNGKISHLIYDDHGEDQTGLLFGLSLSELPHQNIHRSEPDLETVVAGLNGLGDRELGLYCLLPVAKEE